MTTNTYATTLDKKEIKLYRKYIKTTNKATEQPTSQPGRLQFNFESIGHAICWLLDQGTEFADDLAYAWADYYNMENVWLDIDNNVNFTTYTDWQNSQIVPRSVFEAMNFEIRIDLR